MSNGGPSHANIQTATVNHVTVQLSQSDLQTIGEAAGSGAGKAISQAFQELKQSITSVGPWVRLIATYKTCSFNYLPNCRLR